jgi:hypothetical protein
VTVEFPPLPKMPPNGTPPVNNSAGQPVLVLVSASTEQKTTIVGRVTSGSARPPASRGAVGGRPPARNPQAGGYSTSTLQLTTFKALRLRPLWERVDDYQPVIRLAPGDGIDIQVTTEVGVSQQESGRIATGLSVGVNVWLASLQGSVSVDQTTTLGTSTREAVSVTRRFTNADPKGSHRLLSFWRRAIQCEVLALEDLAIVGPFDAEKFQRWSDLWSDVEGLSWRSQSTTLIYPTKHFDYSDAFVQDGP